MGCALRRPRLAGQAARRRCQTAGRAPAVLPGNGLAQHDFVYSGESHDRKIFIVRGGKIVWSYDDPAGRGEISDMVMLSNGNILFAHQFGVTEIAPDKKVVWNYDVPAGHEIHTAVPIGKDRVLYIMNGDPGAVLRVVNIATGAIEKELPLAVKQPVSVHGQFRHARLTPAGTLMVAHMNLGKVVEYDSNGHELWSFPGPSVWSADPLANGNVLITDRIGRARGDAARRYGVELDPGGRARLQVREPAGGAAAGQRRHGDQQLGERVDQQRGQRSGIGAGDRGEPGKADCVGSARVERAERAGAGDFDPVPGPAGDDGAGGRSLRGDKIERATGSVLGARALRVARRSR